MGARDVAVGEAQNIFQADLNINIDVVVMMPISPVRASDCLYGVIYLFRRPRNRSNAFSLPVWRQGSNDQR